MDLTVCGHVQCVTRERSRGCGIRDKWDIESFSYFKISKLIKLFLQRSVTACNTDKIGKPYQWRGFFTTVRWHVVIAIDGRGEFGGTQRQTRGPSSDAAVTPCQGLASSWQTTSCVIYSYVICQMRYRHPHWTECEITRNIYYHTAWVHKSQ
jgi:hypothetical protein